MTPWKHHMGNHRWRFVVCASTVVTYVCIVSIFGIAPVRSQELNKLPNFPCSSSDSPLTGDAKKLFMTYCLDCHDGSSQEGGLNLVALLEKNTFDSTFIFENVITGKMPPGDMEQPTDAERSVMLEWLATVQDKSEQKSYRRISRHEFVHSVNDLLGVKLDLADSIPEDRGTRDFDSDRRIMLTKEMLSAYFVAADKMIEFAFPENGYPPDQSWLTSQIKDSHPTYSSYVRDYKDGLLFSWTRANNGNNYSFFYDGFTPSVKGWYEFTFDAAKVGDFAEDISLQVYAGKYYFADDRPQPQRLLDVISLGNKDVKSLTVRGFLQPGENVSVHCFSKHTWRQKTGDQGAYIKQLKVRGPVLEQWPPKPFTKTFAGLALNVPQRETQESVVGKTELQQIGGRISVSSFQKGMEKEKMQDGSTRTFWHTRFTPDVAKPPHYVILENPASKEISGLSYATWSGGNGNGQVKEYSISLSDDGNRWGKPIVQGHLNTQWSTEQNILFPAKTSKRYIKFIVTDAVSLDGKSLASIGKLDVISEEGVDRKKATNATVTVASVSQNDLKRVIRRFAEKAFSSKLSEEDLAPYNKASLDSLVTTGDFVRATKIGLKSVICSHRFLLAPGVHKRKSYRAAAYLARVLWLSVPDKRLLDLAESGRLSGEMVRVEIDRMIKDTRSQRMVHSFCSQWLNLRSFNSVSPSLKLYPVYDDLVNHYLPLETEAYMNHLIHENLPVSRLIDSDFSFLNQRLAQHYGIDGVIGQQMRKVTFSPQTPRGGILTMGSVLKITTDGFTTSPILRGAWISRNIAGNTLSPPPESVTAIEPDANHVATLKEQIDAHKNQSGCYACHKSIDPYGFALESFDATGQWRTRYQVEKPHVGTFIYRPEGYFKLAGNVESSGMVGESTFDDVFGLKKILLSDYKKVAYNFAKKYFEYANGYKPTLLQRIELFKMIPTVSEDCRLKNLIHQVLMYSVKGGRQ